ncbi:hypothetical protein NHH88_26935 [Oxalobacteraceae bacterium OTU3CAMAD1]|nr:hypothetical protein NHH88_26935 [Oxalobacteraceae bacterium OTU3CAMAD1]
MKTGLKSVRLTEDKNDLSAVIAASIGQKKRNLVAQQAAVVAAYDYYANELSNSKLKPLTFSPAVHKAYYSLFDGKGPTVKKIKAYIKSDAEDVCLYCSLNDYDSLDHYLPRANFPEFSMSSRNLVPICTICNRDWKKQIWGGGSARPFLHPNFDYIDSVDYLVCDVSIKSNALLIKFNIDKTKIEDGVLADVLANHFKNLDLASRLRKRTQKDEVDDLIRSMQGKLTIVEKEAALRGYVTQLLRNKQDIRLQAFYKGVHDVIPTIAATQWALV